MSAPVQATEVEAAEEADAADEVMEVEGNMEGDVNKDGGRTDIRQQAAESIQPGCKQWVIATWLPREAKPQLKHLRNEMMRRGGVPPKSWKPQQVADWLRKHSTLAVNVELHDAQCTQGVKELMTNEEDLTQVDVSCPDGGIVACRWYAIRQGCRLLHVIKELKEQFLTRDAGHQSRNEKECAARNSFWVNAASKFNDPTFKPICITMGDVQ
ncbi:hypothetical protein AB1Y20_012810 [Prymnesium parvum]|uniref:Uncharacterized protein n=1 Tax=Prymnesium parvum TaxID=97485 RepID=A0AB34IIY0_PRYPA